MQHPPPLVKMLWSIPDPANLPCHLLSPGPPLTSKAT